MTPDLVAELLRQLMKEAMILAAPVLISAALISFILSLFQTLTSLQEQSLTSVPRLAAIALILLAGMPWFLAYVSSTSRYSGCTVRATSTRPLPVARTAIIAASGTAVDPSYIDALATSMPVSWQIMVWNSKMVVRVPCAISAW